MEGKYISVAVPSCLSPYHLTPSNHTFQQTPITITVIMSMSLEDAAVERQPKPVPKTPENVLEQFSMKGKVVDITGGSDGIEWAVAEAIAEAGGDMALWCNTKDAAVSKGAGLAKKHGITARAYQVEVSDWQAVERVVGKVVEDLESWMSWLPMLEWRSAKQLQNRRSRSTGNRRSKSFRHMRRT